MIDGSDKPSLDELSHFGVKGMKWGQRKMAGSSAFKKQVHGAAVVSGSVVKSAVSGTRKTVDYVKSHKLQIAGAIVAASLLHEVGSVGVKAASEGIISKASRNRDAARITAKILSSTASQINYSKMVKGAYKITTL